VACIPHWLGNGAQLSVTGDDGWSASGAIPKLVHYGPRDGLPNAVPTQIGSRGFSLSQLRCFMDCQIRWWFKYFLKVPDRRPPHGLGAINCFYESSMKKAK
jgi:hypothetical protein